MTYLARSELAAFQFLEDVKAHTRQCRRPRRRTRIVATIGPASSSPATIATLVEAGMDAARVSFAHGSISDAIGLMDCIRSVAPRVGILADLPGPKIRCTPFLGRGALLQAGAQVVIASAAAAPTSSEARIGVAVDEDVMGLAEGDIVSLGDGGVSLVVVGRLGDEPIAQVCSGGTVMGRPGVTVPSNKVHMEVPTPEDLERIAALARVGIEAVAVSFVRRPQDIERVRSALTRSDTMVMAKIETHEAVENLDAITRASDAVMVARGDLGVRVPLEDVPFHQKKIIRTGVHFGRPVVTATQMLESMVNAAVPTRAEVSDVANAVLDGTSAVMLSGETAIGVDPPRAVSMMARIIERTEQDFDYTGWGLSLGIQDVSGEAFPLRRIAAAVTGAAWHAALEEDAVAIIVCTQSGSTVRAISRFRPPMPIVVVTPNEQTLKQLTVSWGVESLLSDRPARTDSDVWHAVELAVEAGFAMPGEVVVVLAGSPYEHDPVADTMRIVRVR